MKWRKLAKISLVGALLLLTGCATIQNDGIPDPIVRWANINAYHVVGAYGTGSGFWIDNETVITACHVVTTDLRYSPEGAVPEVFVKNNTGELVFRFRIATCDAKSDIAILKRQFRPEEPPLLLGSTPIMSTIPKGRPTIWGAGYPLNLPLIITEGEWQQLVDRTTGNKGYVVTAPTIMGDSGSPVLIIIDGRIWIAGIRQAIVGLPGPMGSRDYVTHLTFVMDGPSILLQLKIYNVRQRIKQLKESINGQNQIMGSSKP